MNLKKTNELTEGTSELTANELLSAKELQKIRHERKKCNFRKNKKATNNLGNLDLSGGLYGI